jgi:hypothetical protein
MRKPKIEVPDIFPDTLLFLLDDTGHETLAGNHTVYGLGGIALRAENNPTQLSPAWKNLRALVNGDPEMPLHAFEFGQQARARPELFQPLGDFFRDYRFVRLAVTASVKTSLPSRPVAGWCGALLRDEHGRDDPKSPWLPAPTLHKRSGRDRSLGVQHLRLPLRPDPRSSGCSQISFFSRSEV